MKVIKNGIQTYFRKEAGWGVMGGGHEEGSQRLNLAVLLKGQ